MSTESNPSAMLGVVLPAVVIGPLAATLASSQGILAAVIFGPLAASAVTLGLAAWIGLKGGLIARRSARMKATAHFEPVWHGTAQG